MKQKQSLALILFLSLLLMDCCFAQDDDDSTPSPFQWNASVTGTVSHVSFKNWNADGAEYSYVAGLKSKMYPRYADGKWSIDGSWDGRFSTFAGNSLAPQKTEDRMELNIKASRILWDNDAQTISVRATLFADVLTQFLPDYDLISDPHSRRYTSNFLAPGYITEGIGIDFRFDSLHLSVVVTPIAAKQTLAFDHGVDRSYFGLRPDQMVKNSPGSYTHLTFNDEIVSKTSLSLTSILFIDYAEKFFVDLSFLGEIDYALTSYLKLYVALHMLNDNAIKVRIYEDLDQDGSSDDFAGVSQRLQMYGQAGIGVNINF